MKILIGLCMFIFGFSDFSNAEECSCLSASLSSENEKVILFFSNNSSYEIAVPKWFLAEIDGQLTHDMFVVKNRFGLSVKYKGFYIKRGDPREIDLIKIAPYSQIKSEINLKNGYINNAGFYKIKYQSYVDFYVKENGLIRRCFDEIKSQQINLKIK